MRFLGFFLTIASCVIAAAAQRSFIGLPPTGANITPGHRFTVQVIRPVSSTHSSFLALLPRHLHTTHCSTLRPIFAFVSILEQHPRITRSGDDHRPRFLRRRAEQRDLPTDRQPGGHGVVQWRLQARAA